MKLAEQTLSDLEKGGWCLQGIAPSFQRRLANGLRVDPNAKSLSELCMGFYGKVHPDHIFLPNLSRAIDPNQLSFSARKIIESTFVEEYECSSLCAFEVGTLDKLQEALTLVEQTDKDLSSLRKANITGFLRVADVNFRSASHPNIFGLILLGDGVRQQTSQQLAISVVHEMAHQELFLVNLLDRLVNQPFDYNEVHAPFQGTKRPPIGRLHSMWALYRMVQFQKIQNEVDDKYCELLVKNVEAFEDQELTPFGKKLVEIARKRAS